MKKKGAGARRAVCGVQMPRVFQTAIDALRAVLSVRLQWRGWGKLPVVFEAMVDSRIGEGREEKERKRGNNYKEGYYGQRMDLILRWFGRCHLHCASSSLTPPSTFVPRT
jgi:hypothetical protein